MNLFDSRNDVEDFETPGTDWRLPENRLEAFKRVCYTRMMEGEIDHWLSGKVIVDYMNLSDEQKAWYCVLFGFSYRNHWAMIVLQEFPEIWNTPIEDIEEWYNDTDKSEGVWKKVKFAKDTKWNVRKFPAFVKSVQEWSKDTGLHNKILEHTSSGSTSKNFDDLNNAFQKELYGIGRMTSWLILQTVYEFFDLDIEKLDFQLENPYCWSQYKALCYLFNRSDIATKEKQKENAALMTENAEIMMEYLNKDNPFHFDVYNIESALCEYRKTAAEPRPREFTGWTVQELIYEYHKLKDLWPNTDWTPYVLALMSKGRNICSPGYDPIYFKVVTHTGMNFNTHYYYDDEPNAYELIDIPISEDCDRPLYIEDDYEQIPEDVRKDYLKRFDPLKHLRYH